METLEKHSYLFILMILNLVVNIYNLDNFIVEMPSWVTSNISSLFTIIKWCDLVKIVKTHIVQNTMKGFNICFTSLFIQFILLLLGFHLTQLTYHLHQQKLEMVNHPYFIMF